MSPDDSTIEFSNWHKTVVYADTEAVSLKHETCQHSHQSCKLNIETQKPCAKGFCSVDKKRGSDYYRFEGEKRIQIMFRGLRENAQSISE